MSPSDELSCARVSMYGITYVVDLEECRVRLLEKAGEWLRTVRGKRRSGPKFAQALSDALGTTVTAGALYAWETGTRTVPAAVLLAASQLTRIPIALDEKAQRSLVDEIAEQVLGRLRSKGLDV